MLIPKRFLIATAQAEEIRIAVSDLLADYILAPLKVYGEENDTTIVVDSIGITRA